jgi:hypothetical protein
MRNHGKLDTDFAMAAQATERALWPASSAKPTNGCEADQTIADMRTIGYYSV